MKSARTSSSKWIWATTLLLLVGAATAKAPAQVAVYPLDVCKDWSAWYNAQAAAPKTLHVTGLCTFHAGGYAVKLIRRKPKGVKPATCILDLAITAPTGIGGIEAGIRHIPLRYSEQTEQQCESIKIEPDDVTVPVKIIR
jgi:hypothetical protein